MKKTVILVAAFLLFMPGIKALHSGDYTITGTIPERFEGEEVMLFHFEDNKIYRVDTTLVVNGEFGFAGNVKKGELNIISCGNYPDEVVSVEFFLERGEIWINLDSVSSFGGSIMNEYLNEYVQEVALKEQLLAKVYAGLSELNDIERERLAAIIRRDIREGEIFFLKNAILSELGVYMFQDRYKDLGYYDAKKIFEKADERIKGDEEIVYYMAYMDNLHEKLQKENEIFYHQGMPAADMKLIQVDEQELQFSEIWKANEYTLLEFWASWCGPCKQLFPELENLAERLKGTNASLVSVSLDERRSDWVRELNKHDFNWAHYCIAPNEKENVDRYDFVGIPHTVLINNKGVVHAAGHFEDVVEELLQLIKEK